MGGVCPTRSRARSRSTSRVRLGAVGLLALVLASPLAACTSPDPADKDPATKAAEASRHAPNPGVRVVEVEGLGNVLANAAGKPLYSNDADTTRRIHCVGTCATTWVPVEVKADIVPAKIEGVNGTFSIVDRAGGTKQLALTGHPLYVYSRDKAGEPVRGNWTSETVGGKKVTWHVVTATGTMPTVRATPTTTDDPSY